MFRIFHHTIFEDKFIQCETANRGVGYVETLVDLVSLILLILPGSLLPQILKKTIPNSFNSRNFKNVS